MGQDLKIVGEIEITLLGEGVFSGCEMLGRFQVFLSLYSPSATVRHSFVMDTAAGSLTEEVDTGTNVGLGDGSIVGVQVIVGTGVLLRIGVDVGVGIGTAVPHPAATIMSRRIRIVIQEQRYGFILILSCS
jgi:hypothetical protein